MSAFQYLTALANKTRHPDAPSPPRTTTPIADLSQGSRLDIASVPIILAQAAGSLIKPIDDTHIVTMIGTLHLPIATGFITYIDYYRVYLSQTDEQDNMSFVSIATRSGHPDKIIELRLYRPYNQIVPATDDEWAFWLLDDPDPDQGGMIGCPVIQSKDADGPVTYQRSWNTVLDTRIQPYTATEQILDREGNITNVSHDMMHYQRSLTNPELSEYMLVSAIEVDNEASVCMWLGIDLDRSDLTAYPA